MSANTGGPGGPKIYNPRCRREPSIELLKQHPCHKCKKFGHWKPSHRRDGMLPAHVKSFDTAEEFAGSLEDHSTCNDGAESQ